MPKSINLFLCDESVTNEMDALSAKARASAEAGEMVWHCTAVPNFQKACLLIIPESTSQPKWAPFLETYFPQVENLENRSTGSILYLETAENRFVIPFGTGHFQLDESALVSDFGLMITANGVKADSIRFLDSNNPSAGMKARVQSDRLSDGIGFDLDSALAFIKRLGGVSETTELGKSLSGSTGLKFNAPDDVSLLIPAIDAALAAYSDTKYKDKGLEIIGSLRPIKDRILSDHLDRQMIAHLIADDGEFVVCSPVILDWDTIGVFKYLGRSDRTAHSELAVSDYINSLTASDYDKFGSPDDFLEDMKKRHSVAASNADDDTIMRKWNVYKCLQGSLEHDGKRYTLSDGKWYFVAEQFRNLIQKTFEDCRHGVNDAEFLNSIILKELDNKGNPKEFVESEGEYNARVAPHLPAIFLDKETGSVPGIAQQKNELCDLLISNGNRLVHVKRGSRASGSLHHLFRQGATAARMLRDPEFLSSIENKLQNKGRQADAIAVKALGAVQCRIEFRIIDRPRIDGNFDIPFFAKVALHYAAREINTAQCRVSVGFIDYEDA